MTISLLVSSFNVPSNVGLRAACGGAGLAFVAVRLWPTAIPEVRSANSSDVTLYRIIAHLRTGKSLCYLDHADQTLGTVSISGFGTLMRSPARPPRFWPPC